jgi:cyanophycin synthetase
MFAAAMAYSLGLTLDQIRNGLRTFNNSFFQSPGRMNVFDEHGFRVILDYGHNEAAIRSMVDLCARLEPRGKRIVCATCPGDRRDDDVRAVARALAGHFDLYLCHTDDDLRDRGPGEVPRMMADELTRVGVDPAAIQVVETESESVRRALEAAEHDDLVLAFCGGITRAWKQIVHFKPANGAPEARRAEQQPDLAAEIEVPDGFTIVSDERGVRIAPLN